MIHFNDFEELEDFLRNKLEELELNTKQGYLPRLELELSFLSKKRKFEFEKTDKKHILSAFLMGLSDTDPVKEDIAPVYTGTPDLPDVDTDISSETQYMAEEYLKGKYGEDKVIHVVTYLSWKGKGLIRDICRALSYDLKLVNELLKVKDEDDPNASFEEVWNGLCDSNYQKTLSPECREWFENSKEKIIYLAKTLEGCIRGYGSHAAGIVISNKDISKQIPIIQTGGGLKTGFQEGLGTRELGELGFIKYDFLGLKTLAIIKTIHELVGKTLEPDITDPNIYWEFEQGNTDFIFQFSSRQMTSILRSVKPQNIDDLAACNALYRPASIKFIPEFIHNSRNSIHPLLDPILGTTRNIMLYQEQTIEIFKKLGGFAPDEAEGTRKIIKLITSSKPDKESLKKWDKVIEKFKKGCLNNGISEGVVEEILESIKESSGYSFNASHSVGYAILAAETMWYKIYYPLEFYYAVIKHADGVKKADDIYIALNKLMAMGFELTFGDINNCSLEFKQLNNKELLLPISLFKNLNKKKTEEFLKQRPFNTLDDVFKLAKKFGDKRSLDAMINMDLLSGLVSEESTMEELYFKNYKKDLVKLTEEEILGFKLKTNVTAHILKELKQKYNILRALGDISFEDKDETVNTAFEIVSSEVRKTKTGKPFLKFKITDSTGTNTYLTYFNPQRAIANGALIAAKCKVSRFGLQLLQILGEANNGDETNEQE